MAKKTRKSYVKEDVRFVKKANELVEARYRFDIWETRIFAVTLSMIQASDADFKEYKINVGQVIEDFGLSKGGDIYHFLREAALNLQKKIISIYSERDGYKTELTIPLFSGIERVIDERARKDADKNIWVTFEPRLKPFLLELKERYLIYDIRSILSIKSVHSIRIYELLKQYEKIGNRIFDIDELKLILGIASNEYSLYGHFKDKVILKAQEDLNNNKETDIKFSFEEIKQGRKVVKLKFNIISHLPERLQMLNLPSTSPKEAEQLEELHVMSEGLIPKETMALWISKTSFEEVKVGIVYTMQRLKAGEKIKNLAAYASKMIFQKSLPGFFEEMSPKAHETQQKHERALLEQELENLKIEHYKNQKRVVENLLQHNQGLKHEIIDGLKYSRDWDRKRTDLQNLEREHIQTLIFMRAMQKRPEHFTALNDAFETKAMELKKSLRQLGWFG
ncbi:MAG: replication initiation protein [Runella zeae]